MWKSKQLCRQRKIIGQTEMSPTLESISLLLHGLSHHFPEALRYSHTQIECCHLIWLQHTISASVTSDSNVITSANKSLYEN